MRWLFWLACILSPCLGQNTTTTSAQNATAFALVYGYPLIAFTKLADAIVPALHVNTIIHVRQLSTAASKFVVKPNVDTVYSSAIFDLSQSDVSLTIPEIPSDQFALFSLYDPYGDNFANIGSDNVNASGQYLLRPRGDRPYGVTLSNSTSNGTSGETNYVAYVDSPSYYGILLVRILVNATNIDAVHSYQDGTLVSNVSRTDTTAMVPPLTSLNYIPSNTTSPAQSALQLLAQFADYDQPETNTNISTVQAELQAAGISNGTFTLQPGVDLEAANASALAQTAASVADPSNSMMLNNGWSISAPASSGNFDNGTNFAYRNAIATSGYLMLQAPNALYPSWTNESAAGAAFGSSQYYLAPSESYIYTFSGKPHVTETGFWSLTAYADNFLIPNSLNRYEAGDRNNITYPDGTFVYGPNASSTKDGSFQILVQAADVAPPSNWTANWLPGPAGGGNMTAVLRWYGATESLLNGSYIYPVVTKQSAITANGTSSSGGGGATASGSGTSTRGTASATSTPGTSGAVHGALGPGIGLAVWGMLLHVIF